MHALAYMRTALHQVQERAWPLFLKAHQWLRLLDETLSPSQRFFTTEERLASAATGTDGWHSEQAATFR